MVKDAYEVLKFIMHSHGINVSVFTKSKKLISS